MSGSDTVSVIKGLLRHFVSHFYNRSQTLFVAVGDFVVPSHVLMRRHSRHASDESNRRLNLSHERLQEQFTRLWKVFLAPIVAAELTELWKRN